LTEIASEFIRYARKAILHHDKGRRRVESIKNKNGDDDDDDDKDNSPNEKTK
jgi:hypothetical protein